MFGIGEMLLILSLILDGATGVIQDKIKHEKPTRPIHIMFWLNVWSIGILAGGEMNVSNSLIYILLMVLSPNTLDVCCIEGI
jgi:hypothetical protein